MKLSIPFIPHDSYIDFILKNIQNLESIYFPLPSGPVLDSRMRLKEIDPAEFTEKLKPLYSIKKYCLLNSRFIHPAAYHDSLFLNRTLDTIEYLDLHSGGVTGIVFSDAYLLNALSLTNRDIIPGLEAAPGINCMMDSSQKILAFFEMIGHSGFKLPGKITLDRSLNRDLPQLKKTIQEIKCRHPLIKIELLANEGCIHHCPFKPAHDAQISFSNLGLSKEKNFITNRTVGCHPYFFQAPERFFKSPFIRPEDLNHYDGLADTIKLCGRTLGAKFLADCIRAYADASFDGNLLSLMDAAYWLSERIHIDNKKLDPGFLSVLTSCPKDCRSCAICHDLFLRASTSKPFEIKNFRDYL